MTRENILHFTSKHQVLKTYSFWCNTTTQRTLPKGSWTMLLLIFQIYLWPCVTLSFELLTHKDDHFMPLTRGALVPICIKTGLFLKHLVHKFGNRWIKERTNGQVENMMPSPAGLAWHKQTGGDHYAFTCHCGLAQTYRWRILTPSPASLAWHSYKQ